ncbi:MAG: DNA-binding protein WhiA [Defluviitaleaceae bacterium]|nr:DNA-binding protein WhiA [Defluviitaleaceae bacterium]
MSFSSDVKEELSFQGDGELDLNRTYVRDAFMEWGTCSNPEKSYHMEFTPPSEDDGIRLCQILKDFGLRPKVTKRRGQTLLYLKEGENIVDALNIMGAHKALMVFENVRILKDINNNVNRQVNFETANLGKTVSAAVQQIEDIQFIADIVGLEIMPEPLEAVAQLRLASPDATLKEIGQMLSPPIGKSGVNHRLRKISAIAAALKNDAQFKGGLSF